MIQLDFHLPQDIFFVRLLSVSVVPKNFPPSFYKFNSKLVSISKNFPLICWEFFK